MVAELSTLDRSGTMTILMSRVMTVVLVYVCTREVESSVSM